ncbi:MAG: ABC transporter ATP-binding protein [Lachnospiraceae bacterium]
MFKVLKYAKGLWYIVVLIFLLLIVQVYGELTLPEFTSDIVDVGIQNNGVEYPIPERISKETMDNLKLFMDEKEWNVVDEFYFEKNNEYRVNISELKNNEYERLKDAMIIPELTLYFFTSDQEDAKKVQGQLKESLTKALSDNVKQQPGLSETPGNLPDVNGMELLDIIKILPKEQVQEMLNNRGEEIAAYPDYMLDAMGIQFVSMEYEKLGIDMNDFQMDYLKHMGIKMLGLAVLIMLVSMVIGFLSSRLAASVGRDVRSQVFNKVMNFSNAEMNQFSTSSLITRCTNDVQQIQMLLTMLFRIVLFAPLMGVGSILKVMKTTTKMVWVIILAVVVIMILIMVLMVVAMPKFKMMQKLVDGLNLVSREILTGLSVIRAFGREEKEEERFDEASTRLMKTQLFTSRTMSLMMPTMMFIMNGVSILIIWAGAYNIENGTIQVGDMIAFLTYAMHIVISFLMISMVSIMMPRAAVAADRIEEVLTCENEIIEKDKPVELSENIKGNIAFNNVSFRYPNAKENALNNITFEAKAGKTTAIIGSTGCGKSTLVHLIPRLLDVTQGSITLDGIDIRDVKLKELRQMIGFVPQKGTLFSGTVASNIRFGNVDADDTVVQEAAAIAQATEFIDEKPKRYDADIAQGGNNVSGGQKQRLAIARAIAKNPQIYVFDDSFSALDYKTDVALRRALREKVGAATVIIVAQRISTILHADHIIVLEDGEIVGQGTHEELMGCNEVYQQIAQSQLSAKDLEGMGC